MTPTEARAEIVERRDRCLRAAWRADAELTGFDKCLAAMSPRAVKRDLRERVLATLSHVPQSIPDIQRVTHGRHRDIERILIRSSRACKAHGGWIGVVFLGQQHITEMAAE